MDSGSDGSKIALKNSEEEEGGVTASLEIMAAANQTSADAAVVAVLTKVEGIFTSQNTLSWWKILVLLYC